MSEGADELADTVHAAYAAWDKQDWDRAARLLQGVVETAAAAGIEASRHPGRDRLAGWVFDLALAHKFRRDWVAARDAGIRAAALSPDRDGEPAWWNLGIAATALHDWPTAREAWTRFGVELPAGTGPPEVDLGTAPVRISTAEGAEVVWCRRIDPARARVLNVPTAGSGRRWDEIVLHDGVPNGERVMNGSVYPVFDELELWAESDVPVQSVRLRVASDQDLSDLYGVAEAAGVTVEVWDTVTPLCRACSEGRVDQGRHDHDHDPAEPSPGRCTLGVAADVAGADSLLRAWVAAAPARRGSATPETVA